MVWDSLPRILCYIQIKNEPDSWDIFCQGAWLTFLNSHTKKRTTEYFVKVFSDIFIDMFIDFSFDSCGISLVH